MVAIAMLTVTLGITNMSSLTISAVTPSNNAPTTMVLVVNNIEGTLLINRFGITLYNEKQSHPTNISKSPAEKLKISK